MYFFLLPHQQQAAVSAGPTVAGFIVPAIFKVLFQTHQI